MLRPRLLLPLLLELLRLWLRLLRLWLLLLLQGLTRCWQWAPWAQALAAQARLPQLW